MEQLGAVDKAGGWELGHQVQPLLPATAAAPSTACSGAVRRQGPGRPGRLGRPGRPGRPGRRALFAFYGGWVRWAFCTFQTAGPGLKVPQLRRSAGRATGLSGLRWSVLPALAE